MEVRGTEKTCQILRVEDAILWVYKQRATTSVQKGKRKVHENVERPNNLVPLYRSKLWNKVERSDEKLRKKRD